MQLAGLFRVLATVYILGFHSATHCYDGIRLVSDAGVTKPVSRELKRGVKSNLAGMDVECHGEAHAGYEGHAFTWGMSFRTANAAECCDACKAHRDVCGNPNTTNPQSALFFHASSQAGPTPCGGGTGGPKFQACNVFIFCPEPLCWANDIHNHTFGECWLKFQEDPAHPKSPSRGKYPPHVRKEHSTAPEYVQWMSGALVSMDAVGTVRPHAASWEINGGGK